MKAKLSLWLFFISIAAFSQPTESLKAATKKLYEANYLMDFDTILSLSYPKMIETIGSDEMLKHIEKHYENDVYRLRLQLEILPFQYGEIKRIEGKSFCVISFRNPMRYTFETKLTPEKVAEYKSQLEKTHKTKEVTFEPKRNSFNVRAITTFVAVSDETTDNQWKFFNFDDDNQEIAFRDFFSAVVQKELGL